MKKKLLAQVAKLAILTFAAAIVVTSADTMTVHAKKVNPDGTDFDYDDITWEGGNGSTGEEAEEALKEIEENLNKALHCSKYEDVNTLNATVKMSKNILKAKKKAGAYVKQTPKPSKVVVNGKALKSNKKTKEYAIAYHLWNEETQDWQLAENGITSPGLYRMWIRGYKDNANRYYTKRIYVYDTVDKVKPMSSVKVKVNKVPYSGEEITSGVIKSVKLGKTNLEEGKDYTVKYLNNVNSGTGIVRLTAVEGSGLVGEKEVNFTITGGTKISKTKVTGLTAKTYNYGKAVTQDMSQVKLTVNGTELNPETDYAVQYYMNNTKVGTAKIVIAGKGSYYGTITKSFKITKIPLTTEMVNEKDIEVKYTGKAVKPEVTLKIGTTDAKNSTVDLKKGTDFTLSYKNNVKAGNAAQIIVTGKGNYSGKITVTFSIVDNSAKTTVNKAESADKADEITDEKVTDSPEEPATDEEVTDATDEPTDTEESENDAGTEENPADDETPADEGTENGTGDEEGTDATEEPADTEGNPADDETPADEGTENSADDEEGTASDETDNTTGSEDTGNTATDEGTGSTDEADAVTDETVSTDTDSEDTSNVTSDDMGNSDSTVSDDTLTLPETQEDVETVIPENSVVEDADTNADAA